ncbi:MAG: magnesium/cobalt transporter CorA [Planctomycetaceae bacterium]
MIPPDSPPPKLELISYTKQSVQAKTITDVEDLTKLDADAVHWINVCGFGDEQLLRRIAEIFEIPLLALEDIVNIPQRPKTEQFDDLLQVVVRMVHAGESNLLVVEQVSLLMGPNFVLTFQEFEEDVFDQVRRRIRSPNGRHRKSGADYLFYSLLDAIVDGYYPVLESIGDHLQSLENDALEYPIPRTLRRINKTRTQLLDLRRSIWPQREAIMRLVHDEFPVVGIEVQSHLRDVYDHCVQITEVIEMYREMASTLMSTYLSSVANRTNDIMKVLTIMGSIFIPLTFLAGIYGMNFENMPELKIPWAYPFLWGVMIVVSLGLLWFFRRKGWLGELPEPDDEPPS